MFLLFISLGKWDKMVWWELFHTGIIVLCKMKQKSGGLVNSEDKCTEVFLVFYIFVDAKTHIFIGGLLYPWLVVLVIIRA